MARCCGNTLRCNCLVTAGPGVTVDGDGSTGAPYVISAEAGAVTCDQVRPCLSAGPGATYDPATGVIGAAISADPGNQVTLGGDDGLFVPPGGGTELQVTDTPSVDLTLTGDGTPGTPYEVSAAVNLDPAPPGGGTNLVQEGPGGLYVECADVRGCLSAGPGVDYDAATGVISATGGDATALTVTDSQTLDLTLTGDGSPGAPYEITGSVVLDPAPPEGGDNLIQEGPNGLYIECGQVRSCLSAGPGAVYDPDTGEIGALISSDPGNQLALGGDDGLFVPAGGGGAVSTADSDCIALTGDGTPGDPITATPVIDPDPDNQLECGPAGLRVTVTPTVTTECGLTGDGTPEAPLGAAVQAWPHPCSVDDAAGGVYCDASGALRADPLGNIRYFTTSVNEAVDNEAVPATTTTGGTLIRTRTLDITNPSDCYPALVITSVEVDVDFVLPPGGRAGHFVYGDEMYRFENRGSATVSDVHTQTTKVLGNTVLPPGGAATVELEIGLGFGLGGATYNRVQSFIRAVCIAVGNVTV